MRYAKCEELNFALRQSAQAESRFTGKRSNAKVLRFVWRAAVGNTGHAVRWPPTRLNMGEEVKRGELRPFHNPDDPANII